jgi:NAD(P)-dependent dehydrogenase (short-subunit alcohol dehydrogenase family)
MAGQVAGKVALVTGGASGIGEACCETLAREGAKVVVTDLDETGGGDVVERIKKAGGEAMFLAQDVTDEARWQPVIDATLKAYGRLDVLVANAGIGIMTPIVDMTLADWRRQQAINLDGVFLTVKYGIPAMRKSGGGSIIMMSSVAGLRGAPMLAAYSATKGGVRLFAKSVALECAAAGDKIRVNSVHPGIIATPIWGKIPTGARGAGHNQPINPRERVPGVVPLARVGEAQDIANGVLFLASDQSSYVTGTELVIDGGMMSGSLPRPPAS